MFRIEVSGKTYEDFQKNLSVIAKDLLKNVAKVHEHQVENITDEMTTVESPFSESEPELKEELPVTTDDTELDSTGLPWDSRIHASSKEKKTNGQWRARRNLDASILSKVTEELRAKYNVAPVAPVAPVLPVQPTIDVEKGAFKKETFIEHFELIASHLINAGKLTKDYVQRLCVHFKVNAIIDLNVAQKDSLYESLVQQNIILRA